MWNLVQKLLIFVVSVPMALGGLYVLVAELLLVHHTYFRFVLAGITMVVMGSLLLWFNFIAPLLGFKAQS